MSKKVMMALAPAGGGHQSVARAITQALSEVAPEVAIDSVNVLSGEYSYFPLTAVPGSYARLTVNLPGVWRGLYHGTNGQLRYTLVERLVQPLMSPALKAALQAARPDLIVALNPAIGYTLRCTIQELGWRVPLGVVISDLIAIHPAWICRGANWHTVPTAEARQVCLAVGLEPGTVHLTGLPVGQDFCREVNDRRALRHALGLPLDGQVVLIVGGGEGVGQVEGTVSALAASGLPCYSIIVAGRNHALRERLLQRTDPATCRVLGYVNNMADWMQAADVLVTKAGPNTILEAVHCSLPLVITGAIPGQEENNISFVTTNGLGLVATRPRDIVAAVAEILTNLELGSQIRAAMVRIRRPQAAGDIARLIRSSLN